MKTYSTSKDWNLLFEENKKLFKNNLKNVKSSFIAFNANIDKIIVFGRKFPFQLDSVRSDVKLPNSLKSLDDLKEALAYSLIRGTAVELRIEDYELYTNLLKTLNFNSKRIGGQMGIVSNTLSKLGAERVIVFSNTMSEEQAKMFDSRVLYPSVKNDNLVLKPVMECGTKRDHTRVNIIIEYKQGLSVKLKDKSIIVPRNNRFIISSPIVKNNPLIPKNLLRKELFNNINRVFLSGYHHISDYNVKEVFREWIHQLKIIKSFNEDLLIHLEYVDLHKDWLNNELLNVLKHVHSFGLNEAELANFIKLLGEKTLSSRIISSGYAPELLVNAGVIVMNKFGLKRLSIHTLEYIISITGKDYPVSAERILHANIYGIRVVNSKAVKGENFLTALNTISRNAMSRKGINAANKDYKSKYTIIIVPNLSEKKVPVLYTVGLGDTVSSAIFYAEET